MPTDARDDIWKAAYSTMYEAGYNEILADYIMARWQRFDDVVKILVALTATGSSGAAGLAIWSLAVFKQIWIALAAIAVILSIVSASLRAPDRLKSWAGSKQECGALYNELETFMFRMRINREFSVADFAKEFENFRSRYSSAKQRIPNDWLATKTIGIRSQEDLNERIKRATLNP